MRAAEISAAGQGTLWRSGTWPGPGGLEPRLQPSSSLLFVHGASTLALGSACGAALRALAACNSADCLRAAALTSGSNSAGLSTPPVRPRPRIGHASPCAPPPPTPLGPRVAATGGSPRSWHGVAVAPGSSRAAEGAWPAQPAGSVRGLENLAGNRGRKTRRLGSCAAGPGVIETGHKESLHSSWGVNGHWEMALAHFP